MRPYIGPNVLIFGGIGKAIQVCHDDGHVGAWCLVELSALGASCRSSSARRWARSALRCSRCCLCSSVSPSTTSSSLLTLRTKSPHRGGKTGKREKPSGYGGRSKSKSSSSGCKTSVGTDPILELVLLDLSSGRVRMETILTK